MAKITLDQLKKLNACGSQRDLFEHTYGSEAEVTEEACRKAAYFFHWSWIAERTLSENLYSEYCRVARKARYDRDTRLGAVLVKKTTQPQLSVLGDTADNIAKRRAAWKNFDETLATTFALLYNAEARRWH